MKIRLCPECGSGHLEGVRTVEIVGVDPEITCRNCPWKGVQSRLYVTEMVARLAGADTREEAGKALLEELFVELYRHTSVPIGQAMKEVGLFPERELMETKGGQQLAARLVRAGVLGAHKGIWDEMADIEEEQHHGKSKSGARVGSEEQPGGGSGEQPGGGSEEPLGS